MLLFLKLRNTKLFLLHLEEPEVHIWDFCYIYGSTSTGHNLYQEQLNQITVSSL